MPKLKQIIRDQISDKHQRLLDAIQYLNNKGITLYNHKNGEELTLINAPKTLGIDRYTGHDLENSYLQRLAEKGYIPSKCSPEHIDLIGQSSHDQQTEL